jgi:hypothetical protein
MATSIVRHSSVNDGGQSMPSRQLADALASQICQVESLKFSNQKIEKETDIRCKT